MTKKIEKKAVEAVKVEKKVNTPKKVEKATEEAVIAPKAIKVERKMTSREVLALKIKEIAKEIMDSDRKLLNKDSKFNIDNYASVGGNNPTLFPLRHKIKCNATNEAQLDAWIQHLSVILEHEFITLSESPVYSK